MVALAEAERRSSPLPLAAIPSPVSVSWPGPGYGNKAFTGREWDQETGLYYYRARYYDPKAGRFISEDPIGFQGGMNFYAYVAGNPVNRLDPSGLWSPAAHDAILQYTYGDKLSQYDIAMLQASSRAFDKAFQDPKYSNWHSMAQRGQSAADAIKARDLFVSAQIQLARNAFRRGDRGEGLWQLAYGLHALMDSTSPNHCDPNGNPKEWNPNNPFGHSPGGNSFSDLWVGSERLRDLSPAILQANSVLLSDAWQRATVGIPGFE